MKAGQYSLPQQKGSQCETQRQPGAYTQCRRTRNRGRAWVTLTPMPARLGEWDRTYTLEEPRPLYTAQKRSQLTLLVAEGHNTTQRSHDITRPHSVRSHLKRLTNCSYPNGRRPSPSLHPFTRACTYIQLAGSKSSASLCAEPLCSFAMNLSKFSILLVFWH